MGQCVCIMCSPCACGLGIAAVSVCNGEQGLGCCVCCMPKSIAARNEAELRRRHNLRMCEIIGGALLSILGWALFFIVSSCQPSEVFDGGWGNFRLKNGASARCSTGLGLLAVLGIGVGGPLFIHGLVLYVVLNVRKSRDEGPLIHPTETAPLGK